MKRSPSPRAVLPAGRPTAARRRRGAVAAAGTALLALATGCAEDPSFAEHPPTPRSANRAERELLERYRPQLRVPGSAAGPIDFYRDYVPRGTLEAEGQRWSDVDRELLAAHLDDPQAVFRHEPRRRWCSARMARRWGRAAA